MQGVRAYPSVTAAAGVVYAISSIMIIVCHM
jgi:hypothetical protein